MYTKVKLLGVVVLLLALLVTGALPAAAQSVPDDTPNQLFLPALASASQGALQVQAAAAAAYTSVNEAVDGPDHCKNNSGVNCNIYDGKEYVWLNGGPVGASLGDGDYFFAVVAPGGQSDPNDGSAENLSDDFDAYTNRTFSVSGGTVSYGGSHDLDGNKIRLMPFADTTNSGGVYIVAICSLANGYPVQSSDCKKDAFKVADEVAYAEAPTIAKDAAGSYDLAYSWAILKSVDKTLVKQVGGSVTFNYTIDVSHDVGVESNWKAEGTITVNNPNLDAITGANVTDAIDGATCTVTGGSDATLAPGDNTFPYNCTFASDPGDSGTNTATVTWPEQILLPSGLLLTEGDASADVAFGFTANEIDECVDVVDSYAGTLGTICVGADNPTSFTYPRIVPVPQWDCMSYDNTATFTTNDTGATDSSSQTVTVCGPAKTGALTIGFWQNKNGQGIIKNGAVTVGVCNSGTWLLQYAPFQDLSATASCSAVATYVTNVIKAASAAGTSMNPMLKAQMLATALDVYFSDPALGGNKINAPAPIGGVSVDLTMICTDMTCAAYEDSSSVFGGSPKTVLEMLTYAAGQSNAGGITWYGNVKSTQELAKDAFDAINNQKVFAP